MRLAFMVGEFEQVERSLDIDVVRGDRGELGACRKQRRQVRRRRIELKG